MKKRLLAVLLAVMLVAALGTVTAWASEGNTDGTAESGLSTQTPLSEYFPDEHFQEWIVRWFDTEEKNGEVYLTENGIEQITEKQTSIGTLGSKPENSQLIQSLKGIEYFTKLESISVINMPYLNTLNLSENTALKYISCHGTGITSITLPNNAKDTLETLVLYNNNKLTSVDVSGYTSLTTVKVSNNNLTSLNVSGCTELSSLNCSGNEGLTKVNISGTQLSGFVHVEGSLEELNAANCTALVTLNVRDNNISSLNVSGCTSLGTLNVSGNKDLKNIDLSGCTGLTSLNCENCDLKKLDVSKNSRLSTLSCNGNTNMTSIDVSGTDVTSLVLVNGNLTEIKVTDCDALATLNVHDNSIAQLDLSGCTGLKQLTCHNNVLKSLTVSGCTALESINCQNNNITELDVSDATGLTGLNCNSNDLVELILPETAEKLDYLYCANNNISSLDLSGCTGLTKIQLYFNPLTEISWPGDSWDKSEVTMLQVRSTGLQNIDLKGFTGLTDMSITTCSNFEATGLKNLYITGNRPWNDYYMVRVQGAEKISMENGHFVIEGSEDTKYGYNVPANTANGFASATDKPFDGGVMDRYGNLVIGAGAENIVEDENGEYIVTFTSDEELIIPTAKITFGEGVQAALKDGELSVPSGQINLTELVLGNSGSKTTINEEPTISIVVDRDTIIDTSNNEATVPAGSRILNENGTATIISKETTIDCEDSSYSTNGQSTITVPANKVDEIYVGENGTVYAPEGSLITREDGTTTVLELGGYITTSGGVHVNVDVNIPDTYDIELIVGEGGEAKTNLLNASAGTTITVTATPDNGYELAYITVDGERIDGTTFKMPEHDVTVRVYFTNGGFPFTDVAPGAWYYDAVSYVYYNGLMDGTSATTFEPNANMTRAMVWAILARIDGETVTGANWLETARAWAMAEGVSDGTDANGLVTREQLATMLWRYAGEPDSDYSLSAFTDAASVSEWAETAMSWAVENGLITGVTANTLVPSGSATRAQCAAILMRYVENI